MTFPAGLPPFATDLAPFALRGRPLWPVVQGGMGVGVSAHRLAGSVAAQGAMGTIASVDLRRHHADLMEASRNGAKAVVDAPFGGYKQSGIGKERAVEAMLDDTQIKSVRVYHG